MYVESANRFYESNKKYFYNKITILDLALAAMEDARHDDARPDKMGAPLEPPFIIALRRLLSELTDPAAREQGRIIAEFIG